MLDNTGWTIVLIILNTFHMFMVLFLVTYAVALRNERKELLARINRRENLLDERENRLNRRHQNLSTMEELKENQIEDHSYTVNANWPYND